ncbi:MAG TPA: 50S ribosomal protein L9 [Ktedonobacterales bacterium]|nr:50S ribosomal protein L9 [Ktedonobacterales bacterium]
MKVILLHEVPGLGAPGDVKDVAAGYARNYLLPRQLVMPATPSELANLRDRVAAAQRRAQKQRETNETLAQRIAAVTLTFAVRVGRGDRLYGSVTSQNIADALQEQEGLVIDRRMIQLREPLRQLGDFPIGVRVGQGIEPRITVRLVSAEALAEQTEGTPAVEDVVLAPEATAEVEEATAEAEETPEAEEPAEA